MTVTAPKHAEGRDRPRRSTSARRMVAGFGLVMAGSAGLPAIPSGPDGLLIEQVTVISPERPRPLGPMDVLVRAGRIVRIAPHIRVGPTARRIDGHGRFLIPGLIDTHVHLGSPVGLDDAILDRQPSLLNDYQRQVPRSYLAFGFTTVVDVDSRPQTRAWFEQAPERPRLYHCGRAVKTAGGYGAFRVQPEAGGENLPNLIYEASSADRWPATLAPGDWSVSRAVARVVEAGGICVKAFVEPGFGGTFHWPTPSRATLDSLRQETRRRGLRFLVHANSVDAWRAAIEAHADVIAHGLWYWPGDRTSPTPPPEARAIIERAARSNIRVQPTLQVLSGQESIFSPAILDDPRFAEAMPASVLEYLRSDAGQEARRSLASEYTRADSGVAALTKVYAERTRAALRLMAAAGVPLLLGTDTPSGDGFGNPPGFNGRLEMQRWSEAGIPLERILASATLDNARAMGLGAELGSIEVGKRADLLLLAADPLARIEAFDTIEWVIKAGEPVARSALVAGAPR